MKFDIKNYLFNLSKVINNLELQKIESLIFELNKTRDNGGVVFVAGNGGSAATASHFVCDLQKTILGNSYSTQKDLNPFKIICLNDNVPLLTAWANDYTFNEVFSKPFRTLASSKDLLIVITGSGNSKNIIEVLNVAKSKNIHSFSLLGFDGGKAKEISMDYILVKSDKYGYIEDCHSVIMHLVTEYFKIENLKNEKK